MSISIILDISASRWHILVTDAETEVAPTARQPDCQSRGNPQPRCLWSAPDSHSIRLSPLAEGRREELTAVLMITDLNTDVLYLMIEKL